MTGAKRNPESDGARSTDDDVHLNYGAAAASIKVMFGKLKAGALEA